MIREYLQAKILAVLQNEGAMIPLAFHGGTALRFLYQLPRFSEDLDFALEKPESPYHFAHLMKAIRTDLEKQGYQTQIKINDQKTVHSAFIKFEELLYDFHLSDQRQENFSIKIEVDTDPPDGAVLATRVIKRYIPLNIQHHDPSSLFAGKLHALFHRPFVKGRDLYDLIWYLSDPAWPEPNLHLLNNALNQTGWHDEPVSQANWRRLLLNRIRTLDLSEAVKDVRPFLENSHEIHLIHQETLVKLLDKENK
ncbi:MAG TPA: nucleotidyl transferase AbiEii/AbiGii toxin family protein [bacterium]|mgnify:CR=1 FL=1|nr:nucleotidyl transferase AbiEii/AbiGii toxin family protein [bacterium]